MTRHLLASILLAVALLLAPAGAQAQSVSPDATLSVLTGSVEVQSNGVWSGAVDGQSIAVGQRVRTGPGAAAVMTHYDGSTTTLDGGTEMLLEQQSPTATGGSNVALRLEFGRLWSRVVRLVDPSSAFEIRSRAGTASIRDGLVGARIAPDGALVCWTFEGDVTVTAGGKMVTVKPQQETTVPVGGAPGPAAARPPPGTVIDVRWTVPLMVRLVDAAGRSVGSADPGVTVNQILNSNADGPWGKTGSMLLRSPGPGTYKLVVEPYGGGKGTIQLSVSRRGESLLTREMTVDTASGGAWETELVLVGAAGATTEAKLGDFVSVTKVPGKVVVPFGLWITLPRPAPLAVVTGNARYIAATGHWVANGFKETWEALGSWLLGDPLTEEFREGNANVQYFERARLEWTPTEGVRLGSIGREELRDRGWLRPDR